MAGLLLRGTVKEKENVFHPKLNSDCQEGILMKFCFGIKNSVTHPRCIAQDYSYLQLPYTVISFFLNLSAYFTVFLFLL